jgi:hypothetical protein
LGPGVHAAPHWPAVTEPATQAVPAELHVCGVEPLHPVLPGVQVAPHCPPVIEPFTHVPDALHVCGVVPLHPVALGAHSPVQAPFVQTYGQAVPLCHAPLESQVCGVLPAAHCFA